MKRRDFIQTMSMTAAAAAFGRVLSMDALPPKPMNVIFILADDLGWSELGCYGNTFNETPNMDRLSQQGMRFTNAYAAAPVCSPYRAALMTGQCPARIGVTDYLRPESNWHIPNEMITLPELFKKAGYVTGMIGKWHLSGYNNMTVKSGPDKHGFDQVIISEQTNIASGSYFHPYNKINPKLPAVLGDKEYLTDRLNYEAVQFIEKNKNRPFFLYKSHYSVHTRLAGKSKLVEHFKSLPNAGKALHDRAFNNKDHQHNPVLAAMLYTIDQGLGMIMQKLQSLGIADNTIIVFSSDNGGDCRVTSNAPLRAGKSHLYEGGIRVPLIVKWPGITQAGSSCDTPTMNIDFYPTFAKQLGINTTSCHPLDGRSVLPLFNGKSIPDRPFYWHYPLAKKHFLGGRSSGAIRLGNWKLIEFFDNQTLELYNLTDDIGEQTNLADKQPDITRKLHQQLTEWRKSVHAELPHGQTYINI